MQGVRLDQYAGVTAAVAEGIPLKETLAQEQIDAAVWPVADRAWKEALAEAPDLCLRFLKLQRQAEDCLSRRVEPLEDDPAAWAGFLGALTLATDPDGMLRSLGLRMADVGRLGRTWKSKAEKDPAVVDRLTALAGKAEPPKAVKCGPTALRPFPWTPARKKPEPPAKASSLEGALPAPRPAAVLPPKQEVPARPEALPSYLAAQQMGAPPSAGPLRPLHQERALFPDPPAPAPPSEERTFDLRGSAPRIRAPLPFTPGPAALPAPGPALPPLDTGTLDLSSNPKPGEPGAGLVVHGLTLAQYASMSAELSVTPEAASTILPKYKVAGDEARRLLGEAWNEAFQRDPPLRARWMQLTAEFRAYLVQQKRSSGG